MSSAHDDEWSQRGPGMLLPHWFLKCVTFSVHGLKVICCVYKVHPHDHSNPLRHRILIGSCFIHVWTGPVCGTSVRIYWGEIEGFVRNTIQDWLFTEIGRVPNGVRSIKHLVEWAIASHGMYESHLCVIYYFNEHVMKAIPLECHTANISSLISVLMLTTKLI